MLVAVHEFGHFWVARRSRFKVLRFSIGFGRPLWRWRGAAPNRTEYWLSRRSRSAATSRCSTSARAASPSRTSPRAFNQPAVPQRIAVLLAGPVFNFVFAILAYWFDVRRLGVPGMQPVDRRGDREGLLRGTCGHRAERRDRRPSAGATSRPGRPRRFAILRACSTTRIDLTRPRDGRQRKTSLLEVGREAELTEPGRAVRGSRVSDPGPPSPRVIGEIDAGLVRPSARASGADDLVLRADGDADRRLGGLGRVRAQHGPARPSRSTCRATASDSSFRSRSARPIRTAAGRSDASGAAARRSAAKLLDDLRAEQRYGVLEAIAARRRQDVGDDRRHREDVRADARRRRLAARTSSGPISIASSRATSAQAGFGRSSTSSPSSASASGSSICSRFRCSTAARSSTSSIEVVKGTPLSERASWSASRSASSFLIAADELRVLQRHHADCSAHEAIRRLAQLIAARLLLGCAALPGCPVARLRRRSSCATCASRARSASRRARCTITCRSTSATRVDEQRAPGGGPRDLTDGLLPGLRDPQGRRHARDRRPRAAVDRRSSTFSGNKDIKTEDLHEVADATSVSRRARSSTTRCSTRSRSSLTRGVLRPRQVRREDQADGRADSTGQHAFGSSIDIEEGDRAKIRQVNIVGNKSFNDDEIRDEFELDTGNWLSFIRQNDRYSKEALEGDLEKLRSYLHGPRLRRFPLGRRAGRDFARQARHLRHDQPHEGDRYTVSDVKLAGEMVVPEDELQRSVLAKPGQIFSQAC